MLAIKFGSNSFNTNCIWTNQTGSSTPAVNVKASSVTVTDADENYIGVTDITQAVATTPVQVDVTGTPPVNTEVGRLKLDKNGTSKADSIASLISYYHAEYNRNFDELIGGFMSDTTINGMDSVIAMLQNESITKQKKAIG